MNNLLKHPSESVKVALILASAAITVTLLVLMYASGILQKGGWVFLLFAALTAYNLWQQNKS